MKNFGIECVTLTMIIVTVYAAPTKVPCKDKRLLLEQIKDAAKELQHNPPDLYVYKISGQHQKCVKKFFCLAEKALKKAMTEFSNEKLKKLEHALHVYSKDESCHLHMGDQYSVKNFLDDVVLCVDSALNNKNITCPR